MTKLKKLLSAISLIVICLVSAVCFVACGGNSNKIKPPAAVDASTIRYDGETLSWQAVDKATAYDISFNGTNTTVYSPKFTSGVSSTTNQVTVTITAKNTGGSADAAGRTFTRLKTINSSDLTFDVNGSMSWEHVDGATSYTVEINGNEKSNGASNIFKDFTYGQRNTIRVKAVGTDDTFATYGTAATKTYLGAPTSVRYDGEMVYWSGTELADSYTLYINGVEKKRDLNGSSCEYATTDKKFKISMQSVGDGVNTFSSKISDEIECVKLDDVSGIRVEDGILKWDAVDYATQYLITLGNNTTMKKTEKCELEIEAGKAHSVSIKPIAEGSDYFFSSWCEAKSVYVLIAPDLQWDNSLSLDGEKQKALYWNNIALAGGYKVQVTKPDGSKDVYDTTTGDPSFNYDYLESGNYELRVKSTPTEVDHYESAYSQPLYVQRLDAPKLLVKDPIESLAEDFSAGFTVKYLKTEGATKYNLYSNNTFVTETRQTSFSVKNVTGGTENLGYEITYSIRSMGGKNGSYVKLDSLTSKATKFNITVLPTPTSLTFEGGSLTWAAVNSANGYSVKTDSAYTPCSGNSFKLNGLSAGEHTVSICAKGNGKEILASPYTAAKNVFKLAAPTDLRIDTETNEGSLYCSPVAHTKTYTVYFNGSSEGITNNNLSNINVKTAQLYSTNGLTVVLTADADYEDGGVYYITSDKSQTYTFIKLKPIDINTVSIKNQQLSWNAPDNVSLSDSGKISYNIYKEDGSFWLNSDRTGIDFSTVAGSEYSYTYTVKCKGDGIKFFNSDESAPITVTKLEKVTLAVNSTLNGYAWDGVVNATAYIFKIGDKEVKRINHDGMHSYEITSDEFLAEMNKVNEYKISVMAVGNANLLVIDSDASTLMQRVVKLTKPVISAEYDSEQVTAEGNIVVNVTTAAEHANGYSYAFNGTKKQDYESPEGVCRVTTDTPGEYTVTVMAKGGLFDENGIFYCDSETSDAKKITLLSAPSEGTIEKTTDNKISWQAIGSVSGYKIVITYTDGTSTTIDGHKYTSYVDKSGKEITSVSVTALGNGNTTITSKTVTKNFNN